MRRLAPFFTVSLALAAGNFSLELSFWPGTQLAASAKVEEHPCGKVVVARVEKLPRLGERGPLIPEVAVEVSASGVVLRRWPLPVDSHPIAVEGDRLLIRSFDTTFWVTPNGVISPYSGRTLPPAPKPAECRRAPDFTGSAYFMCVASRDLTSQRVRWIQYQPPCT